MGSFSLIHWLIVGVIILLLFGGNRFSAMMGDVAKGLKSFKQGMADDDQPGQRPADPRQLPPQQPYQQPPQQSGQPPAQPYAPPPQQQPIDITPRPVDPAAPPRDDSAQ